MVTQKSPDFAQETEAIDEAMDVLNSDKFDELADAMKNNKAASVEINGRMIQFEPDIPESTGISAMILDDGFVLSKRAFSSTEELAKTVFQEIHRLNFSEVVKTRVNKFPNHQKIKKSYKNKFCNSLTFKAPPLMSLSNRFNLITR